jgi:hypothetical protein
VSHCREAECLRGLRPRRRLESPPTL